jgi:hypothetical protein
MKKTKREYKAKLTIYDMPEDFKGVAKWLKNCLKQIEKGNKDPSKYDKIANWKLMN